MTTIPVQIQERLLPHFEDRYGRRQGLTWACAPGRVNLIGDHTDYNDGLVLPATLEQAVYAMAAPRRDRRVRAYALNVEEDHHFSLDDAVPQGGTWHHYLQGVTAAVHREVNMPLGFDVVLYGDVPLGSGLSSSAALEVAVLKVLEGLSGVTIDPVRGALLCQKVEHEVIGVRCGIMDQFASRLGKAGHALFLDCRSLEHEPVPMSLGSAQLLIVDSRAPRALVDSAYNERRSACEKAVSILQAIDPEIHALRDVSPELFEAHAHALASPVGERCRHVVRENDRVLASVHALKQGDLNTLGALMNASHESLRDDYEVSCPELDLLVSEAQAYGGVYGARMTGAGFGGCIVVVLERYATQALKAHLHGIYADKYGLTPGFYTLERGMEAASERLVEA